MKYLTERYWNDFLKVVITKDKKEKIVHDGKKFENLIEELLSLLYKNQNIHWRATKTTHDGNKDFIGTKEDGSCIWAECKNYGSNISLKVIAPTLVMAEINNIQEILVFSYSAINKSTREKLLYYANKRNKKIYYYDDINLENLLFRFRTILFPKYFKDFKEEIVFEESIEPYIFWCSMPGIHYNNETELGSTIFTVKLNELIFTGIGIVNNNYQQKICVKFSIEEWNDLEYMEIVDSTVKKSEQFKWRKEIVLEPGEAAFCKLYFKPTRYKKEFLLPTIKLTFKNCILSEKIIRFKKIECNYLFKVPLIGSKYNDALKGIQDYTINKSKMSLALFYGKSGVGKSRLLQEILSIYIREHYQILNFAIDTSSKDSFLMLREIIYFIYNLTPELVIESFKEYKDCDSIWGNEYKEIITLLQNAKEDSSIIFSELLQKYKYFIFKKILSQKNVFIFDNIQFAEPILVDFLYDLCIYAKTSQSNTNFVLVLSYNEDYYCNSSVKKLRLLAEELKNQYCLNIFIQEVEGMKKDHLALAFLRYLIHAENEEDIYLNMIVEKANYIPKHIENIVEYLMNKQILAVKDNYFIIKSPKEFYTLIEQLPQSFTDVFEKRFQLFLENEQLNNEMVVLVIAAIHFLQHITVNHLCNLGLDENVVQKLLQYNFIDINDLKELQFNHDLYEQYFMEKYLLEDKFLNFISTQKALELYNFNYWQKTVISMRTKREIKVTLSNIISSWSNLEDQVPYKLKQYFYEQIVDFLVLYNKQITDFDDFMICSRDICLDAKNKIGIRFSNILFEKVYEEIQSINVEEKEKFDGYHKFINEYCENLLQNSEKKVITIYKARIKYLSQNTKNNYKVLARLYNRMYVYYKHIKDEQDVHKYLEKSMNICKEYDLLGMQVENLYDEGNYYIFLPEKKDNLIECWNSGYLLFQTNRNILGYLTLNSLKKKIQTELLCNKYDEIEDYLEEAFEYVENGEFNQQTLFFNASLYQLKAIYGLLTQKICVEDIHSSIDLASKYYVLKNNEKPYTIQFLYAKFSYLKENYQEMVMYYNSALKTLNRRHHYYEHIKKVMLDDFSFKFAMIKEKQIELEIDYKNVLTDLTEKAGYIDNLSKSQILEFIRDFRTISNLCDKHRKDGFIF